MIKESSTSSEKRSEKRKRTHRANHPHKSVGALPIEWSWHSVSKCTFLHQPCGEQGFWTLCGRTALTLLPSQRWWAIDYFFVSPPFSILPLLRKYLLINYHHHRNCMHFILNCILHENNLLCSAHKLSMHANAFNEVISLIFFLNAILLRNFDNVLMNILEKDDF